MEGDICYCGNVIKGTGGHYCKPCKNKKYRNKINNLPNNNPVKINYKKKRRDREKKRRLLLTGNKLSIFKTSKKKHSDTYKKNLRIGYLARCCKIPTPILKQMSPKLIDNYRKQIKLCRQLKSINQRINIEMAGEIRDAAMEEFNKEPKSNAKHGHLALRAMTVQTI